jgi:prepilin-type processing-associated H-X9-DG protein
MLINHDLYPNGAFLGSYIKTPATFKCPADHSTATIFGAKKDRVRSLSMNNFVGSPSQPINSSATSAYPTYPKTTSILSPTMTFVFLDEREDSINDGTFYTAVNQAATAYLIDIPASYHGGAAGFSFADGHSEIHKWHAAWILQPIRATTINNHSLTGDYPEDAYWLDLHAVGTGSFP